MVPEFEELNKAVRAPNDAKGCTARLIHVAGDERVALAPLVKLRTRHINRTPDGTMRRRKGSGHSRIQDHIERVPSTILPAPRGSNRMTERPISHTGDATRRARTKP